MGQRTATDEIEWWVGLILAFGCRIESRDAGAGVQIVKDGAGVPPVLVVGNHASLEDSLVHAVTEFVTGRGAPALHGYHPNCRTDGVVSTFSHRCALAGTEYRPGELGQWLDPQGPGDERRGLAFVIDSQEQRVRLTFKYYRLGNPIRDFAKVGLGLDYRAALLAAIAAPEQQVDADFDEGREVGEG